MPVNRCTFLRSGYLIVNSYLDGITPVGLNRWSGKLIIDEQDCLLIPIWGYNSTLDGKVISSYDTSVG